MVTTEPLVNSADRSVAAALLRAAVAAGVVAVVGVELVSALSLLSVLTGGLLALLAMAVFARLAFPALRAAAGSGFGVEQAVVVLFAAVTLVTSLVAAPNTWDSMTYHLARVDQWLARGSVGHFATSIDRQVWQPPFAEYFLVLARSVAGGGDRLANLVQWLASLGAALAAARIATALGAGRRGSWVAAVLVITAPTVVLQATSTQNDLVAAFWIAATAAFALDGLARPEDRSAWLWAGASFALAIGTKGTGLVFGIPWLVGLGLGARRQGAATLPKGGLVALAVIGVVNAPWMLRNVDTYGNPFGDPVIQRLLRPASMMAPAVASNLIANASIHWATPIEATRQGAETIVAATNRALGVAPAALYPYFGGLRVEPWSTDEDLAGNPLLFLTGLLAIVASVRRWRSLGEVERVAIAAVLGGVLLFGIGVRWQPFNGRLQLPGFVLLAPLVAVATARFGSIAWRWLGIVAAVTALPALLGNRIRPLLGGGYPPAAAETRVASIFTAPRATQYFVRQPDQYQAYQRTVARLVGSGCEMIGVKAGYDSWEYPLWALSRAVGARFRLEHVQVENATARYSRVGKPLCALVAIDQRPDWSPGSGFIGWAVVERAGRLSVWMPGPPAP